MRSKSVTLYLLAIGCLRLIQPKENIAIIAATSLDNCPMFALFKVLLQTNRAINNRVIIIHFNVIKESF